MQQHGSKYYARSPSSPQPRGCGQTSTLSEHGHVAYQIKGNHKCSNMVAKILPADPPIRSRECSNMVANHECSNMVAHILPTAPSPSDPGGGVDLFVCLFDLFLYVHSTIFQLCGTGLPGLNQY